MLLCAVRGSVAACALLAVWQAGDIAGEARSQGRMALLIQATHRRLMPLTQNANPG
ncbi:MAG: hypothetical protein WAV85_18185 [Rhodoferax sp.]